MAHFLSEGSMRLVWLLFRALGTQHLFFSLTCQLEEVIILLYFFCYLAAVALNLKEHKSPSGVVSETSGRFFFLKLGNEIDKVF